VPDAPSLSSDDGLVVARVLSPHGLQGEIRCRLVTEFPDRFQRDLRIFIGEAPAPFEILSARVQADLIYLRLKGISDRTAAEELQGREVRVALQDAVPLEEGRFYWYQVIGLRVEDEEGQPLGQVQDILETAANDVYVVRGPLGEILIPVTQEIVKEIAPDAGRIVIHPIPGLLPEPKAPRRRWHKREKR
jgi:16S rRNA processing protein RimM